MFRLTLFKTLVLILILIFLIFGDVRRIDLYTRLIKHNLSKNLKKIKLIIRNFFKNNN